MLAGDVLLPPAGQTRKNGRVKNSRLLQDLIQERFLINLDKQ